MRKNKKEPKSYTMLILTIFLGVIVLGGVSIMALSYFGVITGDTDSLMFVPPPKSYVINLTENMGAKSVP